jgi:TPR repeat protein
LREWKALALKGHAQAQFRVGSLYDEGEGVPQDFKEAAKWYRLAATQGHASAQNNLGMLYSNGQGVAQDDKEAMRWCRLAADQGNPYAQTTVGWLYANGVGTTQDDKEAVRWYRLAAEQGFATAQSNLGQMYASGTGVTANKVIAYALLTLAESGDSSGDKKATGERATLAKSMNFNEVREARALSRTLGKAKSFLNALDQAVQQQAVGHSTPK